MLQVKQLGGLNGLLRLGSATLVLVPLFILVHLACDVSVTDEQPSMPSDGVTHAPTITSAPANAGDGDLVTISGINFGSHTREVEWTGGANGMIERLPLNTEMRAPAVAAFPSLGRWGEYLSSGVTRPFITNERVHSHNQAIKGWIDDSFDGSYNSGVEYKHAHKFDELYATWWTYFEPIKGNRGAGGAAPYIYVGWKMWRLQTYPHEPGAPGQIYLSEGYVTEPTPGYSLGVFTRGIQLSAADPACWGDYNTLGMTCSATSCCVNNWWAWPDGEWNEYLPNRPDDGHKWVRWEVYAKRSDLDVRNGTFQVWISIPGETSAQLVNWDENVCTHRDLSRNPPTLSQTTPESWIWAVWQNFSVGSRVNFFHDDIYMQFDTGKARVEIGNAQVWANCTHREVQPPAEAPADWSDSSLQIRLNQGSFSPGSRVWLYVINRKGVVSNGFPLTLN